MSIPSKVSHYLSELLETEEKERTVWDEKKVAGVSLQESSSTTLPPNSRFSFVLDGELLNPDEIDNQVTHEQPLYRFPLNAGDSWVIGGTDRNPYTPGFESETGLAFQTSDQPPEGEYLPTDLSLIEVGYGTLYDQALTGVPHESFEYSKEGGVLHLEKEDADLRIYKNGDVANSLHISNWLFNPFTDPDFEIDVSMFPLVRPTFDLYGAGDFTFFMRLRDKDEVAHLKELGTVGIRGEPLLRIYNHSMQLKMEATDSVTGNQRGFLGPLQYHNRFDGDVTSRTKEDTVRGAQINDDTGDDNWTVVRVYRIDIDRREAATFATRLRVADSADNVNSQLKATHRDFLDFGATDPDDDSNWRAVGESTVRETSIERLDVASDTVTINTFTDEDGETKIRGEKELASTSVSGQGGFTSTGETDSTTPLNELKYIVLVAQIAGGNSAADLLEPETTQLW